MAMSVHVDGPDALSIDDDLAPPLRRLRRRRVRQTASAKRETRQRASTTAEHFSSVCHHLRSPPKNCFRREELLDRHENRMPDLSVHVLRQVALAGSVLDQDHLADADHPALAVAGGYLHPGVEIDDVLPARRRVPVDVMLGLRLAKDDTRGRQALGKLAAPALLDPLHFDVAEMRLSARVGIQIKYAHRRLSSNLARLTEPFFHNTPDVWYVQTGKPERSTVRPS